MYWDGQSGLQSSLLLVAASCLQPVLQFVLGLPPYALCLHLCCWLTPHDALPNSAGLLTPLSTPRGRPENAAAALPPSTAATPAPRLAATPQQQAQPSAQQQAGGAAEPLLGAPLWSPMLPAGAAPAAPLGAGLLGTLRKAPRDGSSIAGGGAAASGSGGPPTKAETAAAGAAQQSAGRQQEASFGEPAGARPRACPCCVPACPV